MLYMLLTCSTSYCLVKALCFARYGIKTLRESLWIHLDHRRHALWFVMYVCRGRVEVLISVHYSCSGFGTSRTWKRIGTMSQSAECGATVVPERYASVPKHDTVCVVGDVVKAGGRRNSEGVGHSLSQIIYRYTRWSVFAPTDHPVPCGDETKKLCGFVHFLCPAPRREHVMSQVYVVPLPVVRAQKILHMSHMLIIVLVWAPERS